MTVAPPARAVGGLLRDWRHRRRLSQLELAVEAEVSPRHLSFVETGRSRPSRELLLHLAEHLEVPLRERNGLLLAAGYAPMYGHATLDSEQMGPVRDALDRVLGGHEPYPAVVVDRHWDLVATNEAARTHLTAGVAAELLAPPVNALRLTLHPHGLAPRIANLAEWSAHLLERLARLVAVTADPVLAALHAELAGYPGVAAGGRGAHDPAAALFVPLVLDAPAGRLALLGTVATFGTALDVTLAELSIEAFFPADAATAALLAAPPT